MIRDHFTAPLSALDRRIVESVPPGGNWRDLPPDFPSKRVQQIRAGVKGGSRSTYYGRLRWDAPAYTISTYFTRPGNGAFIHPEADRLISIREAARLQGFPDHYRFAGGVRARCLQVGNAVPPPLAYQLASVLPRGTAVDLFCGAGGFSLGFEWAGFDLILAVDNDDAALRTFRQNRPTDEAIVLHADLAGEDGVRQVVGSIKERLGSASPAVLLGGPPCQGFSTAGKYLPEDPRNRLVWQYLKVVAVLKPMVVLMENVPALMWGRNRGVIDAIRTELLRVGYRSSIAVLHAEAYGVPQLRRRLFVLASRDPSFIRWPAPVFELGAPSMRKWQPMGGDGPGRVGPSVRDAIGDLPFTTAGDVDSVVDYAGPAASSYQSWARGELPINEFLSSGGAVDGYDSASGTQLDFLTEGIG